jgi:hypothetical protein
MVMTNHNRFYDPNLLCKRVIFFGLPVIASHAAPTTSSVQTDALRLSSLTHLSHTLPVYSNHLTNQYNVSLNGATETENSL